MLNVAGKYFNYLINDTKIRTKILIFVGFSMIFFILLVSFFTFKKVENIVNKETGDSMMQVLNQINNNIEYNIRNSETAIDLFYNGSRIKPIISMNYPEDEDGSSFIKILRQEIYSFKCLNDNVIDLRIFLFNELLEKDNISAFGMQSIKNEPRLKPLIEQSNPNMFYWTNIDDDTWNKFRYTPALFCYKEIFNDINNRPIGILRTDISLKSVFDTINSVKFGMSGVVLVASEDGSIIYSSKSTKSDSEYMKAIAKEIALRNETKGSFTASIMNRDEFLAFDRNNKLGWYVIGAITQNEFKEQANSIREFIVLISLGICVLAFISILFFSALITNRIKRLSNAMEGIGKGNLKADVKVYGKDEVGQLTKNFKLMVKRIEELVEKTDEHYRRESILMNEKHELELLKKEAELMTLQMQINPHFLYNTFEMIKGLLFSNDYKNNIINAIQALSEMFKYNLNANYIVKVRDEITHIEDYILIHNLRFDKTIRLENNMDEEVHNLNIMRFTFEPLVENAIKHGLRTNNGDGTIIISAKIFKGELIISLKDNGKGMTIERLTNVKSMLEGDGHLKREDKNSGIGMNNVNERIKKHFGTKFGLEIKSRDGEGTTVYIHLPVINNQSLLEAEEREKNVWNIDS